MVSGPATKSTYFVSKARGLILSGWKKEKKQAGIIDEPEQFLEFTDHLHTTSDKETIAFIKSSLEWDRIKEFDNVKDAMTYRAAVELAMATEEEGKIENTHKEAVEFEGKSPEAIAAAKAKG